MNLATSIVAKMWGNAIGDFAENNRVFLVQNTMGNWDEQACCIGTGFAEANFAGYIPNDNTPWNAVQGVLSNEQVIRIAALHMVTDPHGQLRDHCLHIHTCILILQVKPLTQTVRC